MKKFASSPDLWAEMKSPLLDRQLDSLMTYLILSVILGGRIGYVFFYNFGYYAANPSLYFVYGTGECRFMEASLGL